MYSEIFSTQLNDKNKAVAISKNVDSSECLVLFIYLVIFNFSV